MTPDVHITPYPEDPRQQVVTFSPPVAVWSFQDGHTLDELWRDLIQGSSALAMDHLEDDFDEEMQRKMRVRILSILLYWKSQGWLSFPTTSDEPVTSTVT